MIQQCFTTDDFKTIITEVRGNLPSSKYDVGQKVISELCSKLLEQVSAAHFTNKLGIKVLPGRADVDPDNLFKFLSGDVPLEIKVAQSMGSRVRFRGGSLSDRTSEYLFVARNKDCTEFFAALAPMVKGDWIAQNTAYYAPYFTETMLYNKPLKILMGSFDIMTKGKRKGLPILKLEKI
jgi:hypothetical protein